MTRVRFPSSAQRESPGQESFLGRESCNAGPRKRPSCLHVPRELAPSTRSRTWPEPVPPATSASCAADTPPGRPLGCSSRLGAYATHVGESSGPRWRCDLTPECPSSARSPRRASTGISLACRASPRPRGDPVRPIGAPELCVAVRPREPVSRFERGHEARRLPRARSAVLAGATKRAATAGSATSSGHCIERLRGELDWHADVSDQSPHGVGACATSTEASSGQSA